MARRLKLNQPRRNAPGRGPGQELDRITPPTYDMSLGRHEQARAEIAELVDRLQPGGLDARSREVLNNLTLNGNTTLNLTAIPGFTVGTYRLFTMTNFTDTGDVVVNNINGPGAFNYSVVETLPNGTDPGHIDLVVTTQQLKWTGATNNAWDINTTVNWQNTGSVAHTATQDAAFFNTGTIAAGTTSAGTKGGKLP